MCPVSRLGPRAELRGQPREGGALGSVTGDEEPSGRELLHDGRHRAHQDVHAFLGDQPARERNRRRIHQGSTARARLGSIQDHPVHRHAVPSQPLAQPGAVRHDQVEDISPASPQPQLTGGPGQTDGTAAVAVNTP